MKVHDRSAVVHLLRSKATISAGSVSREAETGTWVEIRNCLHSIGEGKSERCHQGERQFAGSGLASVTIAVTKSLVV